MRKLIILADQLDRLHQFKSADRVDKVLGKFAGFFGRSKEDQAAADMLSDVIMDAVMNISPETPSLQQFIQQAGGFEKLLDSLEKVSEDLLRKLE